MRPSTLRDSVLQGERVKRWTAPVRAPSPSGASRARTSAPPLGNSGAEEVTVGEAAVERDRPGRPRSPSEQQGGLAAPRPGVPVGEGHLGPGHAPAQQAGDGVGEDGRRPAARPAPKGEAEGLAAGRIGIRDRDGVGRRLRPDA